MDGVILASRKPERHLLWALCHGCKKRHPIEIILDGDGSSASLDTQVSDWKEKHRGSLCSIEFRTSLRRRRIHREQESLLLMGKRVGEYELNVNDLTAYAASNNFAVTNLNSLASDTNLLTGAQCGTVDNTGNKYLDYFFAAKLTTGTTPTKGTIEVWLYAALNDTPLYPDVLDGTTNTKTLTTAGIKRHALYLVDPIEMDSTTTNVAFFTGPVLVSSIFGGGFVPHLWGPFFLHNTVAALNSSGNTISSKGLYTTS